MIPAALQSRIDRLARRAHAFHRFAHHPLCEAYSGEVVALGRWRICRGCLLVGCGLAGGAGVGARVPPAPFGVSAFLLGAWVLALLALSRWRPPKLGSRFLPAMMGGGLAVMGLRSPWPLGPALALLVLAVAFAFRRAYTARGPHRSPCELCPERNAPGICSGFRRQASRERAFRRLVGRWTAPDGGARRKPVPPSSGL